MKFQMFKDYAAIFRFIKPNKLFYFFILTCDCLIEICLYLWTPLVMKLMIDSAVKSNMKLFKCGILLTLAISVSAMIFFIIVEFFLFSSFHKTTVNIRKRLFSDILKLPVSYIEQNHSGDTVSRLTNDINAMQGGYSWPLRMMLVSLLTGIGSGLIMFILDWKISIILIAIGALSVFVNSAQSKQVKKINNDIQANMGKYTENLTNIIGGFMTIRSIQFEDQMLKKSQNINNEIYNKSLTLATKSALTESANFIFSSINFIGVIILASFLAAKGLSSLGSVVSMVFLLGHVNRMFGNINNMIIQIHSFTAGSKRVLQLMENQKEPDRIESGSGTDFEAMIGLKNINFSYDNSSLVLNGVNIRVEKGKIAALVGPSGCGKSTVLKLLLGYYQPLSGSLIINNKPVSNYKMEELRSLISYVPQDSYIFDGTIEENIKFGKIDASSQEVIAAAKAAYADEFISEFEKGYETLVGELGVKLSGGQRQRIAIARAFLKNSPILLLDEATSSLDSYSEMRIQEALNSLMKGKSVLIIAHRLSTVENSDEIYVINEGKTVMSGSHSQLIEGCELYNKLYTMQFSG